MRAYERGGAAALSVLTEEAHFGGSLADLREARAATRPADPAQGLHASTPTSCTRPRPPAPTRCCWWSGPFARRSWPALRAGAGDLDLDALVEVSRDEELESALELDADVIGINNRDLEDFSVDLQRTFDLLADVPAGKMVVSESGIRTATDRGARAGGGGRRAGRRDADAGARSRGRRARAHRRRGRGPGLSSPSGRRAARLTPPTMGRMATLPELDPPAVAELGARLRENVARAVKAPEQALRDVRRRACSPRATC